MFGTIDGDIYYTRCSGLGVGMGGEFRVWGWDVEWIGLGGDLHVPMPPIISVVAPINDSKEMYASSSRIHLLLRSLFPGLNLRKKLLGSGMHLFRTQVRVTAS